MAARSRHPVKGRTRAPASSCGCRCGEATIIKLFLRNHPIAESGCCELRKKDGTSSAVVRILGRPLDVLVFSQHCWRIAMRVFLVDSQPIFREGLRSIIAAEQDLRVVGEASDHDGLMQTIENVDVVILEGGMDALAFLGSLEKSRR